MLTFNVGSTVSGTWLNPELSDGNRLFIEALPSHIGTIDFGLFLLAPSSVSLMHDEAIVLVHRALPKTKQTNPTTYNTPPYLEKGFIWNVTS